MINISLLLGLLVLGVSATEFADHINQARGQLIFSHVMFRHGDRMPLKPYPTDPYSNLSDWPATWGALSVRGMQQHYALGKWLRQRYGNVLLSEYYSPEEIYVRSTDVDRTLQSAQANLAGLYPPKCGQVWNSCLLWQPIPVHTVDRSQDWLIGGSLPSCPLFEKTFLGMLLSPEIRSLNEHSKPWLDYAAYYSGLKLNGTITGFGNILQLRDTLLVQKLYGKVLPEWTKAIFPSAEFDQLCQFFYNMPTLTPALAKLRIGFLIKDILDRSASKAAGTLKPNRSVFVYSAHDNVLNSLMNALGIFNNEFVQYAACLMFELRASPTGPKIEIFYKKSSETDVATPLYIPKCGYACPITQLYELYESIIPTQSFAKSCHL